MINQIITTKGQIQFIDGSTGKVTDVDAINVYTRFNEDTVSFMLIALPASSGLAIFTSKAKDLTVDGVTYNIDQLKDVIATKFAAAASGGGGGGEGGVSVIVVTELPSVGQTNVIYLVQRSTGGYDEYIYVNGEWDLIGDTDISLEGYLKVDELYNYVYSKSEVETKLDGKQDTLVSGTNIKTINGESLLGTGNIDIEGGSGGGDSHYTSKVNSDINYDAPVITVTNGNLNRVERNLSTAQSEDTYNFTSINITNSFDTTAVHKLYKTGTSASITYQDFNYGTVNVAYYNASTNLLTFQSDQINDDSYTFINQTWYVGNTVIKENGNNYFNNGATMRLATTWDDGDELRIVGGQWYQSNMQFNGLKYVSMSDRYTETYTDTAITDTIQVDYRGAKYHIVPKETIKTVNGQSLIGTGNINITADYPKYSGSTSYSSSEYYVIRGDFANKIRTSDSWISSNSGNVKTVIDRYKYSSSSSLPSYTGNTLAIINKTQKTVSEFVQFTNDTWSVYDGLPSKNDVIYYGGVKSSFYISSEQGSFITTVQGSNLVWESFTDSVGQLLKPVLTECETSGGTFVTKDNNTMTPGKYYKLHYYNTNDYQDYGLNELNYSYIGISSNDDIKYLKTTTKEEDNDASNSLYMLGSGNQKLRVLTEKDLSNVPGGTVDAYTKAEADSRFGTLSEQQSLRSDVENALGDIAALGYDKQNKLTGDYVKDVEIGGSYLNFNSMKFDGNNNGSKSVNFKTIGGQPIFGAGDINVPKLWSGTKSQYDQITNKDANTIYLIHD